MSELRGGQPPESPRPEAERSDGGSDPRILDLVEGRGDDATSTDLQRLAPVDPGDPELPEEPPGTSPESRADASLPAAEHEPDDSRDGEAESTAPLADDQVDARELVTGSSVELVDARGVPIAEFDVTTTERFIEDKTAKNLYVVPPGRDAPEQSPSQWADRQIYEKTRIKIEALGSADGTRANPAGSGSSGVPPLGNLSELRRFTFRIEHDAAELRTGVQEGLRKLQDAFPNWSFDAEYGPRSRDLE